MTTEATWERLLDRVEEAYRPAGGFARKFARGKVARDPLFKPLVSQGWIRPGARVLDIGCGQGLLGALLRAIDAEDEWPSEWAPAPKGVRLTGIDFASRDIERARVALGPSAELICGDMREVGLPACETAVLFDVLHYIAPDEQDALLARVAATLAPGGRVLMRVGDTREGGGYALSKLIDRLVTLARRGSFAETYGRTVPAWTTALEGLGLNVKAHPMSQGTPFPNVVLVGDLANIPK